jgi:thiol-disulfide isomerase/thioredoxin
MPETPSSMIPLGSKAPSFELMDTVTHRMVTLQDCRSPIATVIMFISNHCPYVKHIQEKLVQIADHYQAKGIHFVAISSNDVKNFPADSPQNMKKEAETFHYSFPYLYDESQSVAKSYRATCTPDFYIFDKTLSCVYRGRFDEATPGNQKPVTGKDLSTALDCLLAKQPIPDNQQPSLGCNIKWREVRE